MSYLKYMGESLLEEKKRLLATNTSELGFAKRSTIVANALTSTLQEPS